MNTYEGIEYDAMVIVLKKLNQLVCMSAGVMSWGDVTKRQHTAEAQPSSGFFRLAGQYYNYLTYFKFKINKQTGHYSKKLIIDEEIGKNHFTKFRSFIWGFIRCTLQ